MDLDIESRLSAARIALGQLSGDTSKSDISDLIDSYKDIKDKLSKAEKAKLLAEFKSRAGADKELGLKIFNFLFNCELTSKKDTGEEVLPEPFPGAGLLALAESIAAFPPEVYPKKWEFTMHDRKYHTGMWGDGAVVADVGLQDITGTSDHDPLSMLYINASTEEQALHNTKNFDNIVKHEIGHGVDEKVGGSALTSQLAGGGWISHGSLKDCLNALGGLVGSLRTEFNTAIGNNLPTPDSAWDSGLTNNDWIDLLSGLGESALAKGTADELVKTLASPLKTKIGNLPGRNHGQSRTLIIDHFPKGNTLIKILVQGGKNQAWASFGDPIAHGGKVYQNSGAVSGWTSFEKSTYGSKVSLYQYYSPGEWFADFYTAINHDSEAVRGKAISAFDGAAKWFKAKGIALYPDEIG